MSLKKDKPNILWICADQQRYDTIGALGNKHINTPNLDKLAKEGVAFTRAYTQSPVCTPSRSCFLTGRYPRTTRSVRNGNEYFPDDEVLVTKILSENGYSCGLAGKFHLSASQGKVEERPDDGYKVFKWSHHPHDDWPEGHDYIDWLLEMGIQWNDIYKGKSEEEAASVKGKKTTRWEGISEKYHQTTWCMKEAIKFIEDESDGPCPWLMSINPYDPHPPFDPPADYRKHYNADDMPDPKWKEGELDNKPLHHKNDFLYGGQDGEGPVCSLMTDKEKKEYIADYYAMIELLDKQIGVMLDVLEETGQRKNTIIIFHSDHGEMLCDHGLIWKGAYFYEELVHVPLIISWPGRFKQGLVSDALVELVDLTPTILDAAGIDKPYYMQGESFLPIMTGEAAPDCHKESVYSEFYGALVAHSSINATMFFDGRYKVVVYQGLLTGELYDLKNDPKEYDNLWDNKDYSELKTEFILKCFDRSIDTIDPKPKRIARY